MREALRKADEAGLDLVEISNAGPLPVCKILDAGKYKYELQKRRQEAKKKQKVVEVKEIKFTPNIGENDYAFKMRNARKFLEEGNKVKFTIRFRGREMSYVFFRPIARLESISLGRKNNAQEVEVAEKEENNL